MRKGVFCGIPPLPLTAATHLAGHIHISHLGMGDILRVPPHLHLHSPGRQWAQASGGEPGQASGGEPCGTSLPATTTSAAQKAAAGMTGWGFFTGLT